MTFPTIRRDEFRAPPIVVEVFSRRERGESGVFNVIAAVQVRGNLAVALQSESATHTITNVRIFKADAALVRQAIHAARTVPGRVDVGDLYARNGVRFPIWTRPGVVWFGRQLPTGAPVGKPTAIFDDAGQMTAMIEALDYLEQHARATPPIVALDAVRRVFELAPDAGEEAITTAVRAALQVEARRGRD